MLDGGEIVRTDDEFLIGTCTKTAKMAVSRIREKLLLDRPIRTVTLEVEDYVHLGSEMSYLGDGVLLVTEKLSKARLCSRYDIYETVAGEENGANCVILQDGAIIVQTGCPETSEWLEHRGFEVEAVDVSEYNKSNGHLSCLSLNLEF